MPSEDYLAFKAAVVASQRRSFLLPPPTEWQQRQLNTWLERLLDKGDPDAHADVERELRRALQLPGSLVDAEDWPDDLDKSDGIDVPADAPLIGWRFWSTVDGHLTAPYWTSKGTLSPTHHMVRWLPGDNASTTLRCRGRGPHPGPDRLCSCGFRAMQSRRVLELLIEGWATAPSVIGRVAVWGRVTGRAHANGRSWYDDPPCTIRASHARILELHADDDPELEAELRATYAVPETDTDEEE